MYRYGFIVIICVLLFVIVSCEKDPNVAEQRPTQPRFEFFELEIPAWLSALDDSLARFAALTLKNVKYAQNLDDLFNCSQELVETNDKPEDKVKQPWTWNYKPKDSPNDKITISDMDDHYYWEYWEYDDEISPDPYLLKLDASQPKEKEKQGDVFFGEFFTWYWTSQNGQLYSIDYFRNSVVLKNGLLFWRDIQMADSSIILPENNDLSVYILFESPGTISITLSTYNYEIDYNWKERYKFILNNKEKTGEWFCYENDEITSQGTWNGND